MYPTLMKEDQIMSTCNHLNLETLGSRVILPKISLKIARANCTCKNKHVTKERGNNYGKVGDYKCKRWVWSKVTTWDGQ